jgi:beta-lactam-binding protein with PASTA domain
MTWLWIVLLIVVAVSSSVLTWWLLSRKNKVPQTPKNLMEAADQALDKKDKAILEFKAGLEELSRKTEEKLRTASEEQRKEFQDIKNKSLPEIAAWIDSLDR